MIKGSVLQEDNTVLNMHVPSNRMPNDVRRRLIELWREIDESTISIGDFSTPISEMDTSSRQEISKDIVKFNNTINQLDIMGTYRVLHPTAAEYTFFSSSHSIHQDGSQFSPQNIL